jgi:hypothetical protein
VVLVAPAVVPATPGAMPPSPLPPPPHAVITSGAYRAIHLKPEARGNGGEVLGISLPTIYNKENLGVIQLRFRSAFHQYA